jgi:HAD superfamily hydrolase (TIGR01509 family)
VLSQAQLIVFDLGGVLASLGRPAEQMGLGMSDEDFWSVWLGSDTVTLLETGKIDEREFFERFPEEIGLAEPVHEFRQRMQRWQLELFPGVIDMLGQLGASHDIALLSNTNSIHWRMVDPDGHFRGLFDHVFLSFEVGHAKPHREIFEHVLNAVRNDPGDILFLDDTENNVAAAASIGIRSERVIGLAGIRSALAVGD